MISMNRIDELKAQPLKKEFLAGFKNRKILKALTIWEIVFSRWTRPKRIEPLDYDEWFDWVWSGVEFDSEFLFLDFGTNAYDIISKLAVANAIYPDGTYSIDFAEELLTLIQGEKNGRN